MAGVILLVTLLGVGLVGQARQTAQELDHTLAALQARNIEQAHFHLTAARTRLDSLRPAQQVVAWIPLSSAQTAAQWWQFLDASTHLGHDLLTIAQYSNPDPAAMLKLAPHLAPYLASIEAQLRTAQQARQGLDPAHLPARFRPRARVALAQWDAFAPALLEAVPPLRQLLPILPDALGANQSVTYLLVIQSQDNLKATGGFLTGVGILTLHQGHIASLAIYDVLEVEARDIPAIPPPDPVQRYLGLGHWVMRDANWWADFRTTAEQVTAFWRLQDSRPVDGVIGITDDGVATLLATLDTVRLPGGDALTVENFKQVTGERINRQADGNPQTAYFRDVAEAILPRVEAMSERQTLELVQALLASLTRRELLVASFDPSVATTLHALKFDGAIAAPSDDYVYLVLDNLADSKLSSLIDTRFTYEVHLTPNASVQQATLTVTQVNQYTDGVRVRGFNRAGEYTGGRWDPQTGQWDKWPGYYGGYLRLFPAAGSQFISATGFDDTPAIGTEGSHPVYGGYVGLWAGTQRQVVFRWQPQHSPTIPGLYRLLIQRQPGAAAHPVTVRVHLPGGYQATDISPQPDTSQTGVTWHTTLTADFAATLRLIPGTN